MDPATALIIGFVAQTLFIAGLVWRLNLRMDRLATKEDIANFLTAPASPIGGLTSPTGGSTRPAGELTSGSTTLKSRSASSTRSSTKSRAADLHSRAFRHWG